MMGYGFGGMMGASGGVAGLLWGLGGMLLLVGLVILIVWAVAHVSERSDYTVPGQRDPLDLLRERFARGEITEAEFSQAKSVLGYQR